MWALNTIEKSTYLSFEKQIRVALQRAKGRKIAIWGASVRGIIAGMILEELGEVEFIFIDNDENKQGQSLSGHSIQAFENIDMAEVYLIISMEYQDSVREMLFDLEWKEEEDFFSLISSDYDELMKELESEYNNEMLIVGASILHTLPIDNRSEKDLSELIDEKYRKKIKILGMTCLGMRNMYYLIKTEISQNLDLKKVILVVSWETLTSYHHILPRTQKPELVKKLKEYIEKSGNEDLITEISQGYNIAQERSLDYDLENKHSPARMDTGLTHNEVLKAYLDISIAEEIDSTCEEIKYLIKILKLAEDNQIQSMLFIEPMNMLLCKEIYGTEFDEVYKEKCDYIKNLAAKYSAVCMDASALLKQEDFSTVNIVNEAVYTAGRIKFADYIVDKLKETGAGNGK